MPAKTPNLRTITLSLCLCSAATSAGAVPSLTILHSFANDGLEGTAPRATLVADPQGNLYGTNTSAGLNTFGTIFKLSKPALAGAPWVASVLHVFGGNDGRFPAGGLVFSGGALYGVAPYGGAHDHGTVFQLTPTGATWSFSKIYDFSGIDGDTPNGDLTADASGNIFGATYVGGSGQGTVFELSPPPAGTTVWSFNTLHYFSAAYVPVKHAIIGDAVNPLGSVMLGADGALYGTGQGGGAKGFGAVFRLAPPVNPGDTWTETLIYSFAGATTGTGPVGKLITNASGAIFGTAAFGGSANAGTVFKLTPTGATWAFTRIANFTGMPTDLHPFAGLVFGKNGALLGTSFDGGNGNPLDGTHNGSGTIFQLKPSANPTGYTKTTIWQFATTGLAGWYPQAALIAGPKGSFYGTTTDENFVARGQGTVFSFTP